MAQVKQFEKILDILLRADGEAVPKDEILKELEDCRLSSLVLYLGHPKQDRDPGRVDQGWSQGCWVSHLSRGDSR